MYTNEQGNKMFTTTKIMYLVLGKNEFAGQSQEVFYLRWFGKTPTFNYLYGVDVTHACQYKHACKVAHYDINCKSW